VRLAILPDRQTTQGWGLIAGNGKFPFLVLDAARSRGIEMTVFAIREEASPELEQAATRLHWIGLGELSRTLDLMHAESVTQAVMAGQVKHNRIFQLLRPDVKLLRLLMSLGTRNTDSLIGAVARVLEKEGIRLVNSTAFLQPLVPHAGVLTRRAPDEEEASDMEYGRGVAHRIAEMDLGQTVIVRARACVAIEAMEGTDEAIERAARLTGGQRIVVVKVSKPGQDMRFDVPVIGRRTLEVMRCANATALAVDAERTLLFEREQLIQDADQAGIAIQAFPATETIGEKEAHPPKEML
jgi:DUF1009 family protein